MQSSIIRKLFELERSVGHLKWSVADLARFSHVSRQTVYNSFGSNKDEILENALKKISLEYYGLTPARMKLAQEDIIASLKLTRDLYLKTPEFVEFYVKWRHTPSKWCEILVDHERLYIEKLKTAFPKKDRDEIMWLFTSFHGLITGPFLNYEDFEKVAKKILQKIES